MTEWRRGLQPNFRMAFLRNGGRLHAGTTGGHDTLPNGYHAETTIMHRVRTLNQETGGEVWQIEAMTSSTLMCQLCFARTDALNLTGHPTIGYAKNPSPTGNTDFRVVTQR